MHAIPILHPGQALAPGNPARMESWTHRAVDLEGTLTKLKQSLLCQRNGNCHCLETSPSPSCPVSSGLGDFQPCHPAVKGLGSDPSSATCSLSDLEQVTSDLHPSFLLYKMDITLLAAKVITRIRHEVFIVCSRFSLVPGPQSGTRVRSSERPT